MNLRAICDQVWGSEPIIISRPKNKNVVIVSEQDFETMAKAQRNQEYLETLEKSMRQADEGQITSFTVDEFDRMTLSLLNNSNLDGKNANN